MKTIICGNIDHDTVMEWCQRSGTFTQHDQFLAGYNWTDETNLCYTNIEPFFMGVRVAVKHGKLNPEDITILFYAEDDTEFQPKIDADGHIDKWPNGFFDEETKALLELL